MSEIRFQTMKKGKLTHLPYIFCKPEPTGKDIKTVTCYVTGDFLLIELYIGK